MATALRATLTIETRASTEALTSTSGAAVSAGSVQSSTSCQPPGTWSQPMNVAPIARRTTKTQLIAQPGRWGGRRPQPPSGAGPQKARK